MNRLAAFGCGLLFGLGLAISGMIDPRRVLGFLDVLGRWDPTLAIVMAGALIVTVPGFALARRLGKPLLASECAWPTRTTIDRRLILGSILFGIGWGLVGLCPGPALVNLATLSPRVIVFVGAMALAMILFDRFPTSSRR
jgi:uncharacterized membrane protein YedE/YeeE